MDNQEIINETTEVIEDTITSPEVKTTAGILVGALIAGGVAIGAAITKWGVPAIKKLADKIKKKTSDEVTDDDDVVVDLDR